MAACPIFCVSSDEKQCHRGAYFTWAFTIHRIKWGVTHFLIGFFGNDYLEFVCFGKDVLPTVSPCLSQLLRNPDE